MDSWEKDSQRLRMAEFRPGLLLRPRLVNVFTEQVYGHPLGE